MGNIKVNPGMEDIKIQLDNIYSNIIPLTTNINSNLDKIRDNWKGTRSDSVLKELETIKSNNNKIPDNLKRNIDFIDEAYKKYKELEVARIAQAQGTTTPTPIPISTPEATPTGVPIIPSPTSTPGVTPTGVPIIPSPTSTPGVTPTVVPITPTPTPIPTLETQQVGGMITPNIENIDFYKTDGYLKELIIGNKGTGYYVAYEEINGERINYLISFGGRKPTDPMPSNMKVFVGLHGSGESADNTYKNGNQAASSLKAVENFYLGKYIKNNGQEQDGIIILPQITRKTFEREKNVDILHNLTTSVISGYSANDKIDISGGSMGGQLTVEFVAKYPNDVGTATVIASGAMNENIFDDPQKLENLRKANILIVCGTSDSKVYPRSLILYNKLTGDKGPNYILDKNDPEALIKIAKENQATGGITYVAVSGAGHNSWDFSAPAVLGKYE